jgi:hypothetical protein
LKDWQPQCSEGIFRLKEFRDFVKSLAPFCGLESLGTGFSRANLGVLELSKILRRNITLDRGEIFDQLHMTPFLSAVFARRT